MLHLDKSLNLAFNIALNSMFKQYLHFLATPISYLLLLSEWLFSSVVLITFRNVALVDKLSHCEIFFQPLDTTFWITPPPAIKSLLYTVLIFQSRGKTCLDKSIKEKSLNQVRRGLN